MCPHCRPRGFFFWGGFFWLDSDTNLAAFALGWELARDGGTAAALSDVRVELGARVTELRAGLAAAVTTLERDRNENRAAMASDISAQVAAAAAAAERGRIAVNRSLTRALASVRHELYDRVAVNEANITALANRSSGVAAYDDIPWDRCVNSRISPASLINNCFPHQMFTSARKKEEHPYASTATAL